MSHQSKPRGARKPGNLPPSAQTPSETPENGNGAGRREGTGPVAGTNGSAADSAELAALAAEAARSAPEIREKLIARYRKSIKEGRYAPDLEGVAERMIHEGLLKDL